VSRSLRRLAAAALGLTLASCATAPPRGAPPAPPALFGAESAAPRVVGRVLDPDRRPLPFAPVRVEAGGARTGTTADEHGVFVVHRPDRSRIRLTVRVAGYALASRDAWPRPGSTDTLWFLMHALPRARDGARRPPEVRLRHGP
jgi:hypothetical protein